MSAIVEHADVEPWACYEELELTAENLKALFENRIPAIRIREFASPAECRSFAAAIGEVGMQHVYNFADADDQKLSSYQTGYIGLTHYNYRHKPKQAYFDEVSEAYQFRNKVTSRSFDAV